MRWMRVRIHKNRSLDRAIRPCRCWLTLTPDARGGAKLAHAEDILIRNVTFHIPTGRSGGWAEGDLAWTRLCELLPVCPPEYHHILEFEHSPEIFEAPDSGWERLRFQNGIGFYIPSSSLTKAKWMLVTPFYSMVSV